MKNLRFTSLFFIFFSVVYYSCIPPEENTIEVPKTSLELAVDDIRHQDFCTPFQKLDLLRPLIASVVEQPNDVLLYNTLLLKASLHKKASQEDSAFFYYSTLKDLAQDNANGEFVARAHYSLGQLYKDDSLLTSFSNFNEAYNGFREEGDSIRAAKSLLGMSRVQKSLGDNPGSSETSTEGLRYLGNKVSPKLKADLYHTLATAFREHKNRDKSIKYIDTSLSIAYDTLRLKEEQKIKKKDRLIYINTKANILADHGQFDEAIQLYAELLFEYASSNKPKEKARVQSNLGHALWSQDPNNPESLILLEEALQIREEKKYIKGLIASNIHLTEYFLKDDPERALAYAEKAYQYAQQRNSLLASKEAITYIISLKENSTKEGKALLRISKELEDMKRRTQDIYADTRFEIENYERQVQDLKIDKTKTEGEKRFLGLAIFLVLLLSILFMGYLIKKHKKDKVKEVVQETFKTEKRLSEKVHDELANDMSVTVSYVEKLSNIPEGPKNLLMNRLENLYERTRDISTEIAGFDLNQFEQSLKHLISQHNTSGTKVITNSLSAINWKKVNDHKKTNIYRSLQELMVNMKKHSEASQVTIIFKSNGTKHSINYTDNGKGAELKQRSIRGLSNVETRMQIINGKATFKTKKGEGFKAQLHFSN